VLLSGDMNFGMPLVLLWNVYKFIFFLILNSSDYLKLGLLKSSFPSVSIVALTATATPQSRFEIKSFLNTELKSIYTNVTL
jgi:hypothetical protein